MKVPPGIFYPLPLGGNRGGLFIFWPGLFDFEPLCTSSRTSFVIPPTLLSRAILEPLGFDCRLSVELALWAARFMPGMVEELGLFKL